MAATETVTRSSAESAQIRAATKIIDGRLKRLESNVEQKDKLKISLAGVVEKGGELRSSLRVMEGDVGKTVAKLASAGAGDPKDVLTVAPVAGASVPDLSLKVDSLYTPGRVISAFGGNVVGNTFTGAASGWNTGGNQVSITLDTSLTTIAQGAVSAAEKATIDADANTSAANAVNSIAYLLQNSQDGVDDDTFNKAETMFNNINADDANSATIKAAAAALRDRVANAAADITGVDVVGDYTREDVLAVLNQMQTKIESEDVIAVRAAAQAVFARNDGVGTPEKQVADVVIAAASSGIDPQSLLQLAIRKAKEVGAEDSTANPGPVQAVYNAIAAQITTITQTFGEAGADLTMQQLATSLNDKLGFEVTADVVKDSAGGEAIRLTQKYDHDVTTLTWNGAAVDKYSVPVEMATLSVNDSVYLSRSNVMEVEGAKFTLKATDPNPIYYTSHDNSAEVLTQGIKDMVEHYNVLALFMASHPNSGREYSKAEAMLSKLGAEISATLGTYGVSSSQHSFSLESKGTVSVAQFKIKEDLMSAVIASDTEAAKTLLTTPKTGLAAKMLATLDTLSEIEKDTQVTLVKVVEQQKLVDDLTAEREKVIVDLEQRQMQLEIMQAGFKAEMDALYAMFGLTIT